MSKEFENLTVVIKTILRYHCLRKTVSAFHSIDPSLKIIIIDDSPIEDRQKVVGENIEHIFTEVDIGVSAGRNLGFQLAETEYILLTDDDDYPIMTRESLLENFNFVKNGNCNLLGFLGVSMSPNEEKKILTMEKHGVTGFQKTDLTSNSFIARRDFLLTNPFNNGIKNIGEHYLFFFNLKKKNYQVFASETFKFKRLHARNSKYNQLRKRDFKHIAIEESGYDPIWEKPSGCCNGG